MLTVMSVPSVLVPGGFDYATLLRVMTLNLPLRLATMTNTAVLANTDIFTSDIAPVTTAGTPVNITVHFSADTSGVLSIVRKVGTPPVTVIETFNNGTALTANAATEFDIVIDSNEVINLRYSVNATVLRCLIVQQGYIVM